MQIKARLVLCNAFISHEKGCETIPYIFQYQQY